jgi:hypothetical protein
MAVLSIFKKETTQRSALKLSIAKKPSTYANPSQINIQKNTAYQSMIDGGFFGVAHY